MNCDIIPSRGIVDGGGAMRIEKYVEQQKERLAAFKKLSKENPERASQQARKNLMSAGILDREGRINEAFK